MSRFTSADRLALAIVALGCSRSARMEPARAGPAAAQERASAAGGHRRSVVYARRGMVAAAHPLAAQIGVEVLREGGSAVDAAIAVNAALGVLEPMMGGVGGDLFALVWDAQGRQLHGLDASGRAPRAIAIEKVTPTPRGLIDPESPASWTVPGAVDGWFALHARFGRLPMARLLAPAIRAAREGEPVPRTIAADFKPAGKTGYARTFLPAPREGELFRNPDLASTLELLARDGRDVFYRGEIARRIVAFSRREGGFFAPEDFAEHASSWVAPISTDYRGYTVWQMPPSGQGLAVLQMLNILENFDLAALGRESPDFWHLLIEAKKLVYEDRAVHYADPGQVAVPLAALLDKDYARRRAAQIDWTRAAQRVDPGIPRSDTTYLAVADGEGNMVSLIQSVYAPCGSRYVPDGLGFCLQNRGAAFSLVPGTANALAPGKKPFHTIIPGFVTRDGAAWLAFGVMGGALQPTGQVQVLINLIDFGMDLQQAGDAPRFQHRGSREPDHRATEPTGGEVALEAGISDAVRAELARRGHRFFTDGFWGGYQAVARDPVTGVLSGATESRKDGCAQGW